MRKSLVATSALLVFVCVGLASPYGMSVVEPPKQQKTATSAAKPALTADALDRLLAPVALYPDALLGQMLLCATNPGKVGALSEWLRSHESLSGTALQDAAKAAGFGESFAAIALFPQVVNTMAEQTEWTANVGHAFTSDKSAVFASIQRLRTKARDAGKLKSTSQQDVETRTTSSGQQVIVIEPANPQVVYVPQYNSQTVYTSSPTSSTVVIKEDDDADVAVAAGLIGFTAGIALGAAIDNDYYYGPYGWHGGAYMYDDAWDDWDDHREDARDDWQDHREDLADERGDRASNAQEQRTERTETRQENRPESQAQREQRRTDAQTRSAADGRLAQARKRAVTAGTRRKRRENAAEPARTRSRATRADGRSAPPANADSAAGVVRAEEGDDGEIQALVMR